MSERPERERSDKPDRMAPYVVIGDVVTASETHREAWPELLAATMPLASPWGALVNLSDARSRGFGDVVRHLGRVALERRARKPVGAVFVCMSYLDGKNQHLPPDLAGPMVRVAVRHAASLVEPGQPVWLIGPTGARAFADKPVEMPPHYGGYDRWLARTEEAVAEVLEEAGEPLTHFLSLRNLPRHHTKDGLVPNRRGWEWVGQRVARWHMGGGALPEHIEADELKAARIAEQAQREAANREEKARRVKEHQERTEGGKKRKRGRDAVPEGQG